MAIQIFDNGVESHPIYEKAGALLSDVCKRDYKDNFFDERIECLDMDTYETMICGGQKQATMDAVIGIADYENNRKTTGKLLMVELRLGYKSTDGLETASLNRKVSHTLELLNPAVCLVSDKAIFVLMNCCINKRFVGCSLRGIPMSQKGVGGNESQDVLQGLSRSRRFALSVNQRFCKRQG